MAASSPYSEPYLSEGKGWNVLFLALAWGHAILRPTTLSDYSFLVILKPFEIPTVLPSYKFARDGLRTVSSKSNVKAAAATTANGTGTTAPRVSSRLPISSSSTPPLSLNSASTPESAFPAGHDRQEQKHFLQQPDDVGNAIEKTKSDDPATTNRDHQEIPQTSTPGLEPPSSAAVAARVDTDATPPTERDHTSSPKSISRMASSAAKTRPAKSAGGKKKQPGSLRRGAPGSAASSTAVGVSSRRLGATSTGSGHERSGTGALHGGGKHHGGGGGKGKGAAGAGAEESPEKHAARNREIFEHNLKALGLPKSVTGKGARGGRYGPEAQIRTVSCK